MTAIIRAPRPQHWTTIENRVLRDKRVGLLARGVLCRLLSNADGFTMTIADIVEDTPSEGRIAIAKAVRELRSVGYIVQKKFRDAQGHLITQTYVTETPEKAVSEAVTGSPLPASGVPTSGTLNVGATDTPLRNAGTPNSSNPNFGALASRNPNFGVLSPLSNTKEKDQKKDQEKDQSRVRLSVVSRAHASARMHASARAQARAREGTHAREAAEGALPAASPTTENAISLAQENPPEYEGAGQQAGEPSTPAQPAVPVGTTQTLAGFEPDEALLAGSAIDALSDPDAMAKTRAAAQTTHGTRWGIERKVSEGWQTLARRECADLGAAEVAAIARAFEDYWVAEPGQKGSRSNWFTTWINWVRREVGSGRGRRSGGWKDPRAIIPPSDFHDPLVRERSRKLAEEMGIRVIGLNA